MFKDQYLFLNFLGENAGPTVHLRVFQGDPLENTPR